MDNDTTFAQWLKQHRGACHLTQEQLADGIGCSQETVRKIESGRRRPSKQLVELLIGRLKVPTEQWDDLIRLARESRDKSDVRIPTWGGDLPIVRTSQQTSEAVAPKTNIPAWRTPFIGREKARAEVRALLLSGTARLVTLTGPGGIGKTRLSFQVATDLLDHFTDGVYNVSLSHVNNPADVGPAIGRVLNVKETPGQSLDATLQTHLSNKQMLLVLDNFEQVTQAGILVNDLLAYAPGLTVLVSSRTPLRISPEHRYEVPPMSVPGQADRPDFEQIAHCEAVELFTQRARAARPDFALTAANAPIVAEICRQVDALPLAIELSAARIKLLPPEALLARLDNRLRLLTTGSQDLPERQQTLRNTIAWSYDLLDEDERALFRRMSVFLGATSLESIEAVASNNDLPIMVDTFELVASLADQSMIRHTEAYTEPRFWMLWTLKEFGLEKLAEAGEEQAMKAAHARYFLALAEQAEPMLRGRDQPLWLNRLENDHPNIRAALEWSRVADPKIFVRLVDALWRFWYVRGHWSEGRQWIEAVRTLDGVLAAELRAKVWYIEGLFATNQSDYAQAAKLLNQSLLMYQELGDRVNISRALEGLGVILCEQGNYEAARVQFEQVLSMRRNLPDRRDIAIVLNNLAHVVTVQGDFDRANDLLDESVAIFGELGDQERKAISINNLGHVAQRQADFPRARQLYEESLQLKRELGNREGIASSLNGLGELALRTSDFEAARAYLDESLAIYHELGEKVGMAMALYNLGRLAHKQVDLAASRAHYQECLNLQATLGNRQAVASCLLELAMVARAQGQPELSTRLLGAIGSMQEAHAVTFDPAAQAELDDTLGAARKALGKDAFRTAWDVGMATPIELGMPNSIRRLVGGSPSQARSPLTPNGSGKLPSTTLQSGGAGV